MPPDLPPEPPNLDYYQGDAPGCGDGAPEAGVWCFERAQITDRFRGPPGIADIDGDGHLDIAWTAYEGVFLQLGNGDGSFAAQQLIDDNYDETFYFDEMLIGDIDQDGDLDLLRANIIEIVPFVNDGAAQFVRGQTITAETYFDFATLADLDLDGQLELVAAEDDGGNALLSLFHFEGGGVTRLASSPIPGCDLNGLAIGEFGPDALPDIAAVGRWCEEQPDLMTPVVSLRNDGGLAFTEVGQFPAGMEVGELVAGDFDADGLLDVAASSYTTGDLRFLRGLGDGNFAAELAAGPAAPDVTSPTDLFAAELDGMPGLETAYVVYRLNYPDDFDQIVTLVVLMDPHDPATTRHWVGEALYGTLGGGDFNEDGILDLLYIDYASEPYHDYMSLLLSNP